MSKYRESYFQNSSQRNSQSHPECSKHWQPSAQLESLKSRAKLLEDIRSFFKMRNVLEVETPLLCKTAATDPYLRPLPAFYSESEHSEPQNFYLQTSPEFAMKRLLAAFGCAIYQICKAFRNGEVGRFHNPEFSMLEWYRPGFNHQDLMDEIDDLLSMVLGTPPALRITYESLFLEYLAINPHQTTLQILINCARSNDIYIQTAEAAMLTIDDWLDILMTHCIEPQLGFSSPVMIYDFPASKAALAKLRRTQSYVVAERFEVYVKGVELANGYHELIDPDIQLKRFEEDCHKREKLGISQIPMDTYLIDALKSGMPDSAGVALGIDRLLMLKLGSQHIQEVIPFPLNRV